MPHSPRQVSRILIDLRRGADEQAFIWRWDRKLSEIDPLLRIRLSSDSRKQMDQNLQGLHVMSYLGGSVSMAAAMFIIFSALSMGVAERQRTLGMLRAIGAYRWQLGWLVVVEGLLLAWAGVIIGIPIGMMLMKLLAWRFDWIFSAGAVMSVGGMVFAAGGSVVTALAASILPAWAAMRTSPLEAMAPLACPPRTRGMILAAILGIVLISLDPLLLTLPIDRDAQFYGHFIVGIGGVMLGFFLLAPLVVWVVERLAAPIVAPMLGIRSVMATKRASGSANGMSSSTIGM